MIPYVLLSTCLFSAAIWQWRIATLSRNWVEVEACLECFEVEEVERPEVNVYVSHKRPRINYRYTVDGQSFEGTRFTLTDDEYLPDGDRVLKDLRWFQPGTSVKAYVNPKIPSEAVLLKNIPKKRKSQIAALFVAGFLIIGVGGILNAA